VNGERWQQIEELFKAVLEREPDERVGFLARACPDEDVKREVASLLRSHERAGSFLEAPALPRRELDQAAELPSGLTFLPDQTVADRFKIVRFLAEGGMGEVYEAWDEELRESVALKTVRLTIAEDEEAESRFMQEIRLARRVTHPNVCRIYDVFHHKVESGNYESRVRFLTMELLAGETLGKRLRRAGPLPLERALPVAEQIAMALAAAHEAGVIAHRDLKPDNVVLVPKRTGFRAVVTDFGLARGAEGMDRETLAAMASAREDLLWILHGMQAGLPEGKRGAMHRLAHRARQKMAAFGLVAPPDPVRTELGKVMGTPDYMSPEQVRGDEVDARADIWSFGVLVHEMLTGELPYRRERSWFGWMRSLSGAKPAPRKLSGAPFRLQAMVRKCLELDASDHYRSFDEVIEELRRIPKGTPGTLGRGRRLLWLFLGGALAAALLYLLLSTWR
jgi:serine/threonine protein kinase